MKKGIYLTEALTNESEQYSRGRMNLIEAQTGQGKTTAAITTIPQQLGIEDMRRCLILIDSTMGRDEKIQMDLCQEWGEHQDGKPYIMTYAKFGSLIKDKILHNGLFDYIACDEIHNLIKYVRIDEANIWKRNPEADYEVICLLLAHESLDYIAADAIIRWMKLGMWTFGFTATPNSLDKWYKLAQYINKIQIHEQLLAYEVFEKYEYGNVHPLLAANPPTKRLIHVPTIELAENFAEEIEEQTGRNVLILSSSSNKKHPLTERQIEALDHLKTNHDYPDGVDDIIATEAYSTGWNLFDDTVEEVIVHSGNKDIQIQFPGRKRGDWKVQYNYNSQLGEAQKRAERLQRQRENKAAMLAGEDWQVPEEYLGRKLIKEDKEHLIEELGYPKKWTTLKKTLEEKGYKITQAGTGVNYGHIIEKP